MKIALVIPTRGVIYARTIKSTILSPELPKDSHIIIVDGLPIPEAHNECVRQALATDCTHIWFVEEDMEIKRGALKLMIYTAEGGEKYVAIDYPLNEQGRTCFKNLSGKLMWTGLGCTLINRKIFDEMDEPYFTTDYEMHLAGDQVREVKKIDPDRKGEIYGRHDAWFGYQLNQRGVKLVGLNNYICKHLRMRSWERKTVNAGQQEIYEL